MFHSLERIRPIVKYFRILVLIVEIHSDFHQAELSIRHIYDTCHNPKSTQLQSMKTGHRVFGFALDHF